MHANPWKVTMQLRHARSVALARTYVAALADNAIDEDASSGYEHVLIELDRLHDDQSPNIDVDAATGDRDLWFELALVAIANLTPVLEFSQNFDGQASSSKHPRDLVFRTRADPGIHLARLEAHEAGNGKACHRAGLMAVALLCSGRAPLHEYHGS